MYWLGGLLIRRLDVGRYVGWVVGCFIGWADGIGGDWTVG